MGIVAFSADLFVAITSGLAGGVTALGGQYLAQRTARRQHTEELRQRSIEMLASFALPVASSRAKGLEELFDLLQQILDTRELTLDRYEQMRRLLIYLPDQLTTKLIRELTAIVKFQRANDDAGLEEAVESVRAIQQEVRGAAGLKSIDSYVKQLDVLRAEAEKG